MYARLIKGKSYLIRQYRFTNTGNALNDFKKIDPETAIYLETLKDQFQVLDKIPDELFERDADRPPVLIRIDLSKLRYWQSGKIRWSPKQPTNLVPFFLAMELMQTGNFISSDRRLHKRIFKDSRGQLHFEWRGIINAHDGYGLSCIRFLENLTRAGTKITLYSHGYHKTNDQGPIVEELLTSKLKESCKWGVIYGQPQGFDDLKTPLRIGFTMFETTEIPETWDWRCNAMDRIWVPSQFCKEVFQKGGVKVPIDIVPLGYEDSIFNYKPHPKQDVFTFFIAANLSERKNARMALKAFRDIFKKGEKVRFVVWPGIFDIPGQPTQDLQEYLKDPRIEIKKFNYSSIDFREQLWKSDCFVFPTHGEGFGIPPVEAMACGVPVICTDWSGCKEYTDIRYNYPIKVGDMGESREMPQYYRGQWANPDYQHLKYLMRFIYEHRTKAMNKAKRGSAWVKKFAVKNIVPTIIQHVKNADNEIRELIAN